MVQLQRMHKKADSTTRKKRGGGGGLGQHLSFLCLSFSLRKYSQSCPQRSSKITGKSGRQEQLAVLGDSIYDLF